MGRQPDDRQHYHAIRDASHDSYARVCSRRSRLPDAYRSARNSPTANSQTTTSQSSIDWTPLQSMGCKRHYRYLISSTVSGTDTVTQVDYTSDNRDTGVGNPLHRPY